MARIGLDATSVSPAGKGHSRTQLEAVRSLAALGTAHELIAFVRTPEAAALIAPAGVRCELARDRRSIVWEQAGVPRAVRRLRLDALFTTTDRLPVVGGCPTVTWLFEVPTHRIELNREHRAGAYQCAADLLTLALWRRSLHTAAVILAGSQATADELAGALPAVSGKLRVVHPGLDPAFSPGAGPAGRGRYVMHIATSDPRDNTETALAAYAAALPRLRERIPMLVPGGMGRREPAVRAEIARLGLAADVVLLGRVSDEELLALYRGASAYLDPTLFEGFGYQVLEAMACGAPVIASGTTSIPEIVLSSGILCDPGRPEEFAAALVRVLDVPGVADDLRRRGLERAVAFTWARAARQIAAALGDALGEAHAA